MAQTVIGFFNNATEAQTAVQALVNNGFDRNSIDVTASNTSNTTATTSNYSTTSGSTGQGITDSISNFFSSLFDDTTESTRYSEVAKRGSTLVTVHAQSNELAQRAADILDQNGAIDVDESYNQYSTQTTNTASTNLTGNTAAATTTAFNETQGEISIPIVEEQLAVGKREVERGGVRVRSRIIERPVEESLRLREEHVHVERRPVDRAATNADFDTFGQGDIVMTEHAEVPVVAKEARVVEEVTVGKAVEERTETISDTVRRTDVEIEEIDTDVDRSRTVGQ